MKRCQLIGVAGPHIPSSQKLRCFAPMMSAGAMVTAFGGTHDQSPPKLCRAFWMIVSGVSSTTRAVAAL